MTKVAVIGCGALGLNYATRLLEAQVYHGEPIDVNLVLRRDFDLVSKEGLVVEYGKAQDAKNYLRFSPEQLVGKVFRTTQDLCERKGPMDWVLVCCKSYAIDEDLHLSLAPLVGEHTNIVVIMNGLGVEEKFVDWFGSQRVFGALSLIACNRGSNPPIEPGPLIVHVYADLKLEVAHVTDNAEKTQLVIGLFKRTTPEDLVQPTTNLLRARWSKLCWNLTYAGIAVAMGGLTCDVIVHDPSLREFATHVIRDVIRVANADILRQHRERHRGTVGAYGSGDTQVGEQAPPCVDLLDEKTILGALSVTTSTVQSVVTSPGGPTVHSFLLHWW